jgi:hypothetical protein
VITPLRTRSRWECSGDRARATDASAESHGMSNTTVRKVLSAVSFARSDESLHSETNGSARCNRRSDPARKCARSAGASLLSNRGRFLQLRVARTFRPGARGALTVHSKGGDDHHSVLKRGIFSRRRMVQKCRSIPSSNRFIPAFLAQSQLCIGSELSNKRNVCQRRRQRSSRGIARYWSNRTSPQS